MRPRTKSIFFLSLCAALPGAASRATEDPNRFLLDIPSTALTLAAIGQDEIDDFGYGSSMVVYRRDAFRVDFLFGGFVPFDDEGMGFGQATSDENFDAGSAFGFGFSGSVGPLTRFGVEFDFVSHEVDGGNVFFPGDLHRFYLLFPVSIDIPFGDADMPFRLGFSIAPGFQIAYPDVDELFQDFNAFNGRFIDEEAFPAVDVRASVTLRGPIGHHAHVLLQAAFDWSYGTAEVEVHNAIGQVLDRRRDEIDLSGLSILGGLSIIW
jgi:hypothetical protein